MDHSLSLFTDLYQLTMAYGYWKQGIASKRAVFHHNFRKKPFGGEFAIAAGLESLIHFIQNFTFTESDLAYLSSLKDASNKPLFEGDFIKYLEGFSFNINMHAVIEGTPIFPYEPLLRVEAPILHAQLLESPLLNIINFQTLIATKAYRICHAAKGDEVIEFGMRRAQGENGALCASRAAYIGGCSSTSHVLAGKVFGIPVRGTHAHSWVMAFDDEMSSFEAFAKVMPNNCVFLIDTFDTIEGAKRAIRVSKKLIIEGHKPLGVRLDSGDLAHLSIEVRKLLDSAGLKDMKIMASNELNEEIIQDLKRQGAQIDLWGVGTHLVTASGQPALDGVYKLSMIEADKGWSYRLKISEQMTKMTNPGILQIRRFINKGQYVADMIYDELEQTNMANEMINPIDVTNVMSVEPHMEHVDLLVPIFQEGKLVYHLPSIQEIRQHALCEMDKFVQTMKRLLNPTPYFVGLENNLYEKKRAIVQELKKGKICNP